MSACLPVSCKLGTAVIGVTDAVVAKCVSAVACPDSVAGGPVGLGVYVLLLSIGKVGQTCPAT